MSDYRATHCSECGTQFSEGLFASSNMTRFMDSDVCFACSRETKTDVEQAQKELVAKATSMPLTTGFTTAAGPVIEEIDVITSECVYGINLFKDLLGGIRDIVGGRAGVHQKVLKDLRQTCLRELRLNAAEIGADAVIGVDLDYSEVAGMLMLVASGTAVKLGPTEASQ